MREPTRNWYFADQTTRGGAHSDAEPDGRGDGAGDGRPDSAGSGREDGATAPGLLGLPATVLLRHGARVLDPGQAAAIPADPPAIPPRSTVYRARTLLIPDYLLQNGAFIREINGVLAGLGIRLIAPPPRPGRGDGDGRAAGLLARLSRPAVLVPAAPADGAVARPVVVDAWVALQALRAAVARPVALTTLDEEAVAQITLEHLLVGSALTITGSPIGGISGGLTAGPGETSSGPGSTDSYMYDGDTRTPVALSMDAPERRSADRCAADFGRRPVVAVLDTGSRAHAWLDVAADPGASGYLTADDGFVAVDHAMQAAIYQEGVQAADAGDEPRQVIRHAWDTPVTADRLLGDLNPDLGHGTFIAGIVRQVEPDAQVLAVRVTHSDGITNEGDLIRGLGLVAERILGTDDRPPAMVDVVSLSMGYFDESPTAADVAYSSAVWHGIEILLGLGVVVVAAAGNYATQQKFYPAAFTTQLSAANPVPLIGVGALNPDQSQALFSNAGDWVTAWAAGAAVLSTFPDDINASRSPEIELQAADGPPGVAREALDADDYRGGFALWSGTSFSAPLVAANIARALLAGAEADTGLRLGGSGAEAADRAMAALGRLGWPA